MNNKSITSSSATSPSTSHLLLVAFFCTFLGYVITQQVLFNDEHREKITKKIATIHQSLCSRGIRLPRLSCEPAVLVKNNSSEQDEPLSQQFARLPNLSAVVEKLQWKNGSEEDAVRLLTVIKTLELGRQRQSRENYQAIPGITQLLAPVWERYPALVMASSCTYCGDSFKVISNLLASNSPSPGILRPMIKQNVRFLATAPAEKLFAPEELQDIASLHAGLGNAGDSQTAEFIGALLLQKDDYRHLKMWVSDGLNGSRALGKTNLDTLPIELVIAAWEQGVRIGNDQPALSRYLVSRGYRPALRWVVWLESTDFKYIHNWYYEREKGQYQAILISFTDFPSTRGKALASFYSEQWGNIRWQENQQRWVHL